MKVDIYDTACLGMPNHNLHVELGFALVRRDAEP